MIKLCNPDKIAQAKYVSEWGNDTVGISKKHLEHLMSVERLGNSRIEYLKSQIKLLEGDRDAHIEYLREKIVSLEGQLCRYSDNEVRLYARCEELTDEILSIKKKYSELYRLQKEDESCMTDTETAE